MMGGAPSAHVAFVLALVDALAADPVALDQLAAALAPRLAAAQQPDVSAGLTTGQAAQRAGIHDRTIRRALAAGVLKGRIVAGRWRIELDDLDAWLDAGAPTTAAPAHHAARVSRQARAASGAAAIAGTPDRVPTRPRRPA